MTETFVELDKELFSYLNNLHTSWLDPVMYFLTHTLSWAPLFVYLLYLIVKHHGKNAWIFLFGITLTVILADQITSTLMKPYFARLRPTHDPSIRDTVHTVNDYFGGKYGFASSHAANTFGVAVLIFLLLRKHFRAAGLIFIWAAFVSYTRIYLGVHFPGDIIAGAIVGGICGWLSYIVSVKLNEKWIAYRRNSV